MSSFNLYLMLASFVDDKYAKVEIVHDHWEKKSVFVLSFYAHKMFPISTFVQCSFYTICFWLRNPIGSCIVEWKFSFLLWLYEFQLHVRKPCSLPQQRTQQLLSQSTLMIFYICSQQERQPTASAGMLGFNHFLRHFFHILAIPSPIDGRRKLVLVCLS